MIIIDLKEDIREETKRIDRMYSEYTINKDFNCRVKKYSLVALRLPFNYGYGCPEFSLGKNQVKKIFNTFRDKTARKFLAYQRYEKEEYDTMFAIYLYDRAWLELYKQGKPITFENLIKVKIDM